MPGDPMLGNFSLRSEFARKFRAGPIGGRLLGSHWPAVLSPHPGVGVSMVVLVGQTELCPPATSGGIRPNSHAYVDQSSHAADSIKPISSRWHGHAVQLTTASRYGAMKRALVFREPDAQNFRLKVF